MIKNLTRKKSAHWFSISRLCLVWLCAVTPCIGQTVLEDPSNDNFDLFEGWPVFGCWDIAQISGGVRASNLYLSATLYYEDRACGLAFTFGLDTDQDSSTGLDRGAFVGADYLVIFNDLRDPQHAAVVSTTSSNSPLLAEVPVVINGKRIEVIVPLELVGGGLGIMGFGAMLATPADAESVYLPDFVAMGGPTSYIAKLSLRQAGANVRISWPSEASQYGEYMLQTATVLTPQPDWDFIFVDPTIEGEESVVLEPITDQPRFYRLVRTFP